MIPMSRNILEMFFQAACTSPNQLAIEPDAQTWTYAELLSNAARIARYLHIEVGEIIYHTADRSLEMACGILAILCAGGAYCPLNPTDSLIHVLPPTDPTQAQYVLVHENTHRRLFNTIDENYHMINLQHILLNDIFDEKVAEEHINIKSFERNNAHQNETLGPVRMIWRSEHMLGIKRIDSSHLVGNENKHEQFVTVSNPIHRTDSDRYWLSFPSSLLGMCQNSDYLNMNQYQPVNDNTNNNNNNSDTNEVTDSTTDHHSLPAFVRDGNEKPQLNGSDFILTVHDSSNVLSDHSQLDNTEEEELPFPGFVDKVFYCLRQENSLRYQCLKLVTWPWFERLTLFVILVNCTTLSMYQPCTSSTEMNSLGKCVSTRCFWLQGLDHLIFVFFTVEMSIRMIAMGIIGKGTYLAESWNRLDCFIVVSGLIELFIPGDHLSLSAIRTVRVLRPLRAIHSIPSMRILVMLLLDTLPMLVNVLLLYFLIFFIFGIIGVQLWKGLLRNRCFLQLNSTARDYSTSVDDFSFPLFYLPSNEDSFICSDVFSSGMNKCSDIPRLQRDDLTCDLNLSSFTSAAFNQCINWNQYYQHCAPSDENPFSGSINFDNIAFAWLAIFQIITLEGWTSIMYYVQDAHSFWDWIYFVSLTIIGSFFMMNVCLAVISAQFNITKKRETEKMLVEQSKFAHSTSSLFTNQQKSCWETIIKQLQRALRSSWQKFQPKRLQAKQKRSGNESTPVQVSSVPLMNGKHQSTCRYYRSETIDSSIGTSHLNSNEINPLSTKQSIETKQVQERNKRCDCHNIDDMVCISVDADKEQRISPSQYCTCWILLQEWISRFVHGKYFDSIIFTAILINTFIMSIEYHGQPQLLTNILEYSNYVFIVIFTIEMTLKILADGCLHYIRNPFNVFDSTIVIISLIELYGANSSGLVVLRTFRLLRVLKLIRFLPTLRRQFIVMIKTLDNVATFFLLLLLFMFIFSILGMHLFGGEFCTLNALNQSSGEQFEIKCRCCTCVEEQLLKNSTDLKDLSCTEQRANFDSLRWALVTVFQILTQEDWNEVLYNGMKKTGPWSSIYFIALMIFGNYVLLNLLVAILVEGFISEKEDNQGGADRIDPFQTEAIMSGDIQLPTTERRLRRNSNQSVSSSTLTEYFSVQERRLIDDEWQSMTIPWRNSYLRTSHSFSQAPTISSYQTARDALDAQSTLTNRMQADPINSSKLDFIQSSSYRSAIYILLKSREDYSLYLFSPSNRFRRLLQWLIEQKSFDSVILLFITLSCLTIAMERPSISPQSFERKFLNYTNDIFSIVFLIEMTIKIIACGLVIGGQTYLRSGWNVIDGFLVITSMIDLVISNRSMLKVFRLLRTLKPLRAINRAPGLRLVVQTLLSSVKPIGHVMLICCVFFIIFAILGVQLFKGKFYYCDGPLARSIKTREECIQLLDHRWINQQYNFDHLGQALLTLFVLSSKDGWVQIMYHGIDAIGVDLQPVRNGNEAKLIYFISFIVLVSFFILNMFVGVIVENFHHCRAEIERQQEVQNREKRAKKLQQQREQFIRELSFHVYYSHWRKELYKFSMNKYFDITIAMIIGLNVMTMSAEFYQMPLVLEKFLEYCNYVFTILFLLEFLVKVVALGPVRYFKDRWNQFDAFVVFLSIFGIAMDKFHADRVLPMNPTLIRVMRLLRMTRILRLLKMAKGIQALLDTVLGALPQVGNLSLLFLLIFFIFAALGVELFGRIQCTEEQPCDGLSKHANFHNFGIALLTLFRVATGDNWNAIMKDTLRQTQLSQGNRTSLAIIVSSLYFIAFVLVTQFVLVNLVVAVLLKKLEDSNRVIAAAAEQDDEQMMIFNEH